LIVSKIRLSANAGLPGYGNKLVMKKTFLLKMIYVLVNALEIVVGESEYINASKLPTIILCRKQIKTKLNEHGVIVPVIKYRLVFCVTSLVIIVHAFF